MRRKKKLGSGLAAVLLMIAALLVVFLIAGMIFG